MVEGACIGIWIKDVPDATEMKILEGYSERVVERIDGYFYLRFEIPKINWFERIQIRRKIGYIPKFEIIVCGGLDCIFLSIEAIMRRYGGYYNYGISKEERESRSIKGKVHTYFSMNFMYGRFEIETHYLVDVEIFSAYFNSMDDEKTKELYSFTP